MWKKLIERKSEPFFSFFFYWLFSFLCSLFSFIFESYLKNFSFLYAKRNEKAKILGLHFRPDLYTANSGNRTNDFTVDDNFTIPSQLLTVSCCIELSVAAICRISNISCRREAKRLQKQFILLETIYAYTFVENRKYD